MKDNIVSFDLIEYLKRRNLLFDDRYKIRLAATIIGSIHAALILIMAILGIWYMMYFNIVSVILYLFIIFYLADKGYHEISLLLTILEVIAHTLMAVFMVGWEPGFGLYMTVIMPISFYILYKKNNLKHTIKISMIYSMTALVVVILCYIISIHISPIYEILDRHDKLSECMHTFNAFVAFLGFTMFGIFFMIENIAYRNRLKNNLSRLKTLTDYDDLTKLYNKKALLIRISEMMNVSDDAFLIACSIENIDKLRHEYKDDKIDDIIARIAMIFADHVGGDVIGRWDESRLVAAMTMTDAHRVGKSARNIEEIINARDENLGKYKIRPHVIITVNKYTRDMTIDNIIKACDDRVMYAQRHDLGVITCNEDGDPIIIKQ